MAFFRKWKLSSKHKNFMFQFPELTEEWALATSLKDFSEAQDEEDEKNLTTFNLKYLGNTNVNSERSENTTAEAIKSVVAASKSSRRKNQRVTLNVSPRGIEMLDPATGDVQLKVSIYKISYCSADAAHDHVFAFIGSEDKKKLDGITISEAVEKTTSSKKLDNEDELLACHVFLCPKRKIAHDVTLTVARCFENAYQIWRHSVERKMYQEEIRNRCNNNNNRNVIKQIENENTKESNDLMKDLLIDLSPNLYEKDHRDFLQNTWITFEEETKDVIGGNQFCKNSWGEQQLVF